jgi:hypothetical protein
MFTNADVYKFNISIGHVGGDVWVGEYTTEDGKKLYYSYENREFVTIQGADRPEEGETVAQCMKLLQELIV